VRDRVLRSSISGLCKRLDVIVREWNERSLTDREYPFLLVDALVVRVLRRESEASWSEFFSRLEEGDFTGWVWSSQMTIRVLLKPFETTFRERRGSCARLTLSVSSWMPAAGFCSVTTRAVTVNLPRAGPGGGTAT